MIKCIQEDCDIAARSKAFKKDSFKCIDGQPDVAIKDVAKMAAVTKDNLYG